MCVCVFHMWGAEVRAHHRHGIADGKRRYLSGQGVPPRAMDLGEIGGIGAESDDRPRDTHGCILLLESAMSKFCQEPRVPSRMACGMIEVVDVWRLRSMTCADGGASYPALQWGGGQGARELGVAATACGGIVVHVTVVGVTSAANPSLLPVFPPIAVERGGEERCSPCERTESRRAHPRRN